MGRNSFGDLNNLRQLIDDKINNRWLKSHKIVDKSFVVFMMCEWNVVSNNSIINCLIVEFFSVSMKICEILLVLPDNEKKWFFHTKSVEDGNVMIWRWEAEAAAEKTAHKKVYVGTCPRKISDINLYLFFEFFSLSFLLVMRKFQACFVFVFQREENDMVNKSKL